MASDVDLRWGPSALPSEIHATGTRTAQRDLLLYVTAYAQTHSEMSGSPKKTACAGLF